MSFTKWVGLLLVLFVHGFVAEDELSAEFGKFMKSNHPTLATDNPLYKDFKNYYKEVFENRKQFHKIYEKLPHTYLMCAMQFMKFEGAKIFHNVTGVGNLKIGPMKQWPARIQKVRTEKDEYNAANPCLMYPSKHNHRAKKEEDDRSYNQWLYFVTYRYPNSNTS